MELLGELWRRLRMLVRRSQFDADLEDEMRLHIELRAQEQMQAGAAPTEARYVGQRRFGNTLLLTEMSREMWGWRWLEVLLQDVRYGLRMLARNPGVTTAVLLSLALGIGANTAIFSLLNAVVLKALPVERPEQLVQFSETYSQGDENSWMSFPYFVRIHDRNQTLSSVFAFAGLGRVNVGFSGKVDLAIGQVATGAYFSTLGVRPAAGRVFTDEDDNARRPVAVISYSYWQRRFGSDSSVVGKTITINQVPFTLIGLTPAPFFGLQVGDSPDITVPMTALDRLSTSPPDWNGAFDSWIQIMGRLKPGVTREQAQAEFKVIHHQVLTDFAPTVKPDQRQFMERMLRTSRLNVKPGAKGFEGLRHNFSLPLQMLMMIVGMVLLIACANVANLLLARAASFTTSVRTRRWRSIFRGGRCGFEAAGANPHGLASPSIAPGSSSIEAGMFPHSCLPSGDQAGSIPAKRAMKVDGVIALISKGKQDSFDMFFRRRNRRPTHKSGYYSNAILLGLSLFELG